MRDLEDYFEYDQDGVIKGMVNEPSDRGLALLILLAVEIQHLSMQAAAKAFGLAVNPTGASAPRGNPGAEGRRWRTRARTGRLTASVAFPVE